jgi:uncharacterized protein (TIGR00269 family)
MGTWSKEKFNQNLEKRVRKLIQEYKLLQKNDKVAIALSGGKDSVLTLHLLSKFREEYNLQLKAISIDEGISGYREDGLKSARKNAKRFGVKLVEKSFQEEFGFKLDGISQCYKSSCIPCGVFRRYLLNKTAHELDADKLATGHNRDDEVQSFLMSFARADFRRFSKFGPKLDKIHPKMVPRIKPLWNTPEKEVGTWAVLNQVDVHFAECPYSQQSLRAKLKAYLNNIEEKRPGTKKNLLLSFQSSFKNQKDLIELVECEKCGQASSLEICKACEMLEEIEMLEDIGSIEF